MGMERRQNMRNSHWLIDLRSIRSCQSCRVQGLVLPHQLGQDLPEYYTETAERYWIGCGEGCCDYVGNLDLVKGIAFTKSGRG